MTLDLFIMMKDIPVMRINTDTFTYEVLNRRLIPWTIKGKLRQAPTWEEDHSKYGETQRQLANKANESAILSWLANRTLLLSRANAKWLYNLLGVDQCTDEYTKAKFSLICRSVSLLDCYWVKLASDRTKWADIDIRHNPLNETIAQVALHGKSVTIQGSLITPELTTNGAYAKAWRRYDDGSIWMHKLGHDGNTESRIEVMCSNLLDKMNVEHVSYVATEDEGKYVCACPCITTDDIGILPAMDFYSCCNVNGLDPDKTALTIDAESIHKMWQVDYLISNRDRHSQNWGFFYNVNTMHIMKCHPLFDHNNAFSIEYMRDDDAPYQFEGMTIRQAGKIGHEKHPIEFVKSINKDDFITTRQYDSFMYRACDLGIIQ